MATSTINNYIGNGITTSFLVGFDYLRKSFVTIYIDDVLQRLGIDYEFSTDNVITFNTAPTNGMSIIIMRNTLIDETIVNYIDPAILSANELNKSFTQSLHLIQELETDIENFDLLRDEYGNLDMEGRRIVNGATPVNDNDFAIKKYVDDNDNQLQDFIESVDADLLSSTNNLNTKINDTSNNLNNRIDELEIVVNENNDSINDLLLVKTQNLQNQIDTIEVGGVKISDAEDNAIATKDDGLFVKDLSKSINEVFAVIVDNVIPNIEDLSGRVDGLDNDSTAQWVIINNHSNDIRELQDSIGNVSNFTLYPTRIAVRESATAATWKTEIDLSPYLPEGSVMFGGYAKIQTVGMGGSNVAVGTDVIEQSIVAATNNYFQAAGNFTLVTKNQKMYIGNPDTTGGIENMDIIITWYATNSETVSGGGGIDLNDLLARVGVNEDNIAKLQLASTGGGFNSIQYITASTTSYPMPVDGWYAITIVGGGGGGGGAGGENGGGGGAAGKVRMFYKYLSKGTVATITVGAGGAGGSAVVGVGSAGVSGGNGGTTIFKDSLTTSSIGGGAGGTGGVHQGLSGQGGAGGGGFGEVANAGNNGNILSQLGTVVYGGNGGNGGSNGTPCGAGGGGGGGRSSTTAAYGGLGGRMGGYGGVDGVTATTTSIGGSGGKGANGVVIIEYFDPNL